MDFLLTRFEYQVYRGDHEAAGRELRALMQMLDSHYGNFAKGFSAKPLAAFGSGPEAELHVLTRIAAAISHLFLDPGFRLSPSGLGQLLPMQRWLATIFSVTPFRNADHVLRALNNFNWESDKLEFTPDNLVKFVLLAFSESEIPVDLDGLWAASPVVAVTLGMLWLAPRFLASPSAHAKRELILGWLPDKLKRMDIDQLPNAILHDVYMHCSYADRPDRHQVKGAINTIVRNKIEREGLRDVPPPPALAAGEKPTMLVVLEWFSGAHSIYRTHSTTMRAARKHFRVIAMGRGACVDAMGREVFDEFISLPDKPIIDQLIQIRATAIKHQARVFYMPSVGMFQLTVFASNLRFAPVQAMALGHPATTLSPRMDYVVVEDDYVGSESCFSEKLIRLPKDALPYVPSAALPKNLVPNIRKHPEVVRIAVCSTTMKLNPRFLNTCKRIIKAARSPVHFEFMVGQATSLIHPHVQRVVKSYLGEQVTVNRHMDYPQYMAKINECDMFINPFPFGNTNGIIDTVTLGLVGVCLSGPEVFEHIDEGLFGRLGVPSWMVTRTVDEYVAAAVRLIDKHEERYRLCEDLLANSRLNVLFQGRPELFGERMLELVTQQGSAAA